MRVGPGEGEELLAQDRVGLDRRVLGRIGLDDVQIARLVGLERDGRVGDVDELDAVERGAAAPVVLVGREGDQLVLFHAGDPERPVADVVGRLGPPVLAGLRRSPA